MKKLIVAVAALTGISGAAVAADMPTKAPPVAVVAANWTGVYGGVGVGWMRSNVNWEWNDPALAAAFTPMRNHVDEGFFSGIVGAQYQVGSFVLGVEASMGSTIAGRFGSTTGDPTTTTCLATAAVACQTKVENVLTVGGRLGWAMNDWLIYGTGGWARASLRSQIAFVPITGLFDTDHSENHDGWFAGGGVEYMLAKTGGVDWIVGVDYKHIDVKSKLHVSSLDAFSSTGAFARNLDATADIVQARVTAKINPWG